MQASKALSQRIDTSALGKKQASENSFPGTEILRCGSLFLAERLLGEVGGWEGASRAVLSHKAMEFSCCPFQGTEGQIMRQRDQSQGSDGARD